MAIVFEDQFKKICSNKLKGIGLKSIEAVLALAEEGNTVPFMARYRKEKTGNLDEVQIRDVLDVHEQWKELVHRKEFVLAEIEKQGNLTAELKKQIEVSLELAEVEELYRPFKRKKKTKAKIAKDAGLEPLAEWIWKLGHGELVGELSEETSLEVKAKEYLNAAAGFATYDEVLKGAQHILIERLSNSAELRALVKANYDEHGILIASKTPKFKANSKYGMYAEYKESVKKLYNRKASHRYLAVRRGWQEGELKVSMEAQDDELFDAFKKQACSEPSSKASSFLYNTAKLALTVHVVPSVTNEIHRKLKDQADFDAIDVFAENVRRVLMSSPFGSKVVLGVDPGLRTGCKIALVDKSGQFISHTVMYMNGDAAGDKAKKLFSEVLKQIKIEAVAVGNGTGGREAETFIRKVLVELGEEAVPVVMVNESGASIYSASEGAREEFPDLDLTVRGAISIARRLQDPLAELVKIDPKSIGVGQYQHDVGQSSLKKSLGNVVEDCVNQVGVSLNTSSKSLLQYVSGIGPGIAKNIVEHRSKNGLFKDRSELLKVPHFSSKVFEQAAGFLRVAESDVALDRTGIHPERYSAVRDMAQEVGVSVSELLGEGAAKLKEVRKRWVELVGEYTFDDIVRELEKPDRDPRDPFKVFKYRDDIHEVKDLKKDMICSGLVTNVTNFGAFVDVGVHQDGLVHISELSETFVNDPRQLISPGDQVKVKVLAVDVDKSQVSLSMILGEKKPVVRAKPNKRAAKKPGEAGQKRAPGKGGKRPNKSAGKRPGGRAGDNKGKPRRPNKPFNNPFAALADLKK